MEWHCVCVSDCLTYLQKCWVRFLLCLCSFSRTVFKMKAASSSKTLVPLYHSIWRHCPRRLQCAAPFVGAFNHSCVRQLRICGVSCLNVVAIVSVYSFVSHNRHLYRVCNLQHLNMEMYFNGSYDGQTSSLPTLLMWEVIVLGMTCLCSVAEHIRETDYNSRNFRENVFCVIHIK